MITERDELYVATMLDRQGREHFICVPRNDLRQDEYWSAVFEDDLSAFEKDVEQFAHRTGRPMEIKSYRSNIVHVRFNQEPRVMESAG